MNKFKVGDIVKLTHWDPDYFTIGVIISVELITTEWLSRYPDFTGRYNIHVLSDDEEYRDGSRYYSVPDSGDIEIITEKERLMYNLKGN